MLNRKQIKGTVIKRIQRLRIKSKGFIWGLFAVKITFDEKESLTI